MRINSIVLLCAFFLGGGVTSVLANAQSLPSVNFSSSSLSMQEGANHCTVSVVKTGTALTSGDSPIQVFLTKAASITDQVNVPSKVDIQPRLSRTIDEVITVLKDGLREKFCITSSDDDIVAPPVSGVLSIATDTADPATYNVGTSGTLLISITEDDTNYLNLDDSFGITAHKATSTSYDITYQIRAPLGILTGAVTTQSGVLTFDGEDREYKTINIDYDCEPRDDQGDLTVRRPWLEVKLDTSAAEAKDLQVTPTEDAWYFCGSPVQESPDGEATVTFDENGQIQQEGQSAYVCEPTVIGRIFLDGEERDSLGCNWVENPNSTPSTPSTPSTDSPSTDSPSTDSPSTDSPSTDSPSTDSPSTDSPDMDSTDDVDPEFANDNEPSSGGCSILSSEGNYAKDALSTFAIFGIVLILISGCRISKNKTM